MQDSYNSSYQFIALSSLSSSMISLTMSVGQLVKMVYIRLIFVDTKVRINGLSNVTTINNSFCMPYEKSMANSLSSSRTIPRRTERVRQKVKGKGSLYFYSAVECRHCQTRVQRSWSSSPTLGSSWRTGLPAC